jgi:predicted RNase H-like HicB family nuclease
MKSQILSFRTIIKKDGKYYHGFVPSLPGCHTQGKTIEETRKNLREAISVWLEARIANGMPIPKDEGLESMETISLDSIPISKAPIYA